MGRETGNKKAEALEHKPPKLDLLHDVRQKRTVTIWPWGGGITTQRTINYNHYYKRFPTLPPGDCPTLFKSRKAAAMVYLPLGHIPDADALVFRVAKDELLARMKHCTGDVVVMPTTSVDLPGFRF